MSAQIISGEAIYQRKEEWKCYDKLPVTVKESMKSGISSKIISGEAIYLLSLMIAYHMAGWLGLASHFR